MTTPQPTSRTSRAVSLSSSAATITGLPAERIPYRRLGTTYPARPFARPTTWRSALESENGSRSRFWYGQEAHRVVDLEALGERDHLGVAGAEARDHDPEVVAVAEEGRRADEAVEVLRVPDVPGVHDDEARHEVVLPAHSLSRGCGVIARVSTQFGITRSRSGGAPFASQPLAHRLADGDDPVGAPQVGADEPAEHADDGGVAEPVELGRDLREDVLADDEHGHAEAAADRDAEVADDRRVGHAEDEIGSRAAQRVRERRAEVREVVRRAPRELGALVRRRRDADDADAVVLVLARRVLVAVQDAGHDLDVVVLRERLAELGQQVRGRLDARASSTG